MCKMREKNGGRGGRTEYPQEPTAIMVRAVVIWTTTATQISPVAIITRLPRPRGRRRRRRRRSIRPSLTPPHLQWPRRLCWHSPYNIQLMLIMGETPKEAISTRPPPSPPHPPRHCWTIRCWQLSDATACYSRHHHRHRRCHRPEVSSAWSHRGCSIGSSTLAAIPVLGRRRPPSQRRDRSPQVIFRPMLPLPLHKQMLLPPEEIMRTATHPAT